MNIISRFNPFSDKHHAFTRLEDAKKSAFWFCVGTFFLSIPTAFLGSAAIFRWLVDNDLGPEDSKIKRISGSRFSSAVSLQTPTTPSPTLTNEETKLLGYRENFPNITLKDFSHIHSSARIHATQYDGGSHVDKYNYWNILLNSLEDDPKYKDSKIVKSIEKVISDGQFVNNLIAKYKNNEITKEELLEEIKKLLINKGTLYFPSGWSHINHETRSEGGHLAIIKFELKEDGVCCYIINKNNSQFHPVVEIDGSKVKKDIRSLTSVVPQNQFEEMLERILQLSTRPTVEQSHVNPYSESDLYGLLYLFAEKIERNDPNPLFASTPQRAGNCTEASLHAAFIDACSEALITSSVSFRSAARHSSVTPASSAIADAITSSSVVTSEASRSTEILTEEVIKASSDDATKNEMQAFMFKFKQESLVHGFVQYYKDAANNPDVRLMLKDAAEQHAIRALKREDNLNLSEDERQKAVEIANLILTKLKALDAVPTIQELPSTEYESHEIAAKPVTTVSSYGKAREAKDYESAQAVQIPHLHIQNVKDPKQLTEYLTSNLEIAKKRMQGGRDPIETFEEVYRLITSLPHGREKMADGKIIWDSLPSEDVDKCFDTICQLNTIMAVCATRQTYKRQKTYVPILDKSQMLEIACRSYDIAAQIAPRIATLNLSADVGFAFPADLIADRKIFSHADTVAALEQVQQNFQERYNNDKTLFSASIVKESYHHTYLKKLYGEADYGLLRNQLALESASSDSEADALNTLLSGKLPRQYYQLEALALMPKDIKRGRMFDVEARLMRDNQDGARSEYDCSGTKNAFGKIVIREFPFKAGTPQATEKNAPIWKNENLMYLAQDVSFSEEKDIPPAIKQELLTLKTDPKPELILAWGVENLAQLENPHVQKEIEDVLFKRHALSQAIKESPEEFKANAEDFLSEAYKHYSHNLTDIDTVLWLLKISDSVQGYFKANEREFDGLKTQAIYNALSARKLSDKARGRLIEHQLDHFNYAPPSTPEDYATILRCTFEYAKLGKSPSTMTYRAQGVISSYYETALNKVGDKTGFLAESLLALYGIESEGSESFRFKGDELTNGTYSFFLNQGLAFQDKKHLSEYSELLQRDPLYKKFFSDTGFVGYVEDGFLYENQGKIRLGVVNNQIEFVEREINGIWYRYTEKPEPLSTPDSLNGPNYAHWVSCDANHPQVIVSNSLNTPLYVYSEDKGLRISNANGTATDNRILDLSTEPIWKEYLSPIESIDHILVEVAKEQVNKITLPRMGLSFERNSEGRLESTLYKGYYLSPKFNSPFQSFKGAMVLENSQGNTKVLIPNHPLTTLQSPNDSIATTTNVETDTSTFIQENIKYFTYDGKKGASIKPATPEAALYLSLIYRNEKQYEKAFSYLEGSLHPNKNNQLEWAIAQQVLNQKDYSSEGIAYDLHLCKRMQEQEEKISKQTRVDTPELLESQKSFSEHVQNQYMRYSNYKSNEKADVYQIPDRFRLTPAMEKALPVAKYAVGDKVTIPTPLSDFSVLTTQVKNGEIPLLSQFVQHMLPALHLEGEIAKQQARSVTAQSLAQRMIANLDIKTKQVAYEAGKLRIKGEVSEYIYNNFATILSQVCSDNEEERKLATIDLLFLSRNNKNEDETKTDTKNTLFLIDVLLYAAENDEEFKAAAQSEQALEACLIKIIQILSSNNQKVTGKFFAAPPHLEFDVQSSPSKHDVTLPEVVVAYVLPDLEFQNVNTPMKTIYKAFFTPGEIQTKKLNTHAFSEVDLEKAESPLAEAQMLSYNTTREIQTQEHKFSANAKVGDLKTQLVTQQAGNQKKVEELKAEIIKLANQTPQDKNIPLSDQTRQQLLQLSGQKRTLNFDDILAGFLSQDTSTIKKANPFLSGEGVQAIFGKLLELYLHESQTLQANEALDIVKQIEASPKTELYQKLGEVLARKRQYDPKEYPLLAIYEGTTGRMLRADQFEAVDWAMKGIEKGQIQDPLRLLQAFAGFGKTKVFTTIMAMMLAQKGYLPTIVNISNLYDFGKSDLGNSLMQAFKQQMEVFEVNLGSQLDRGDLEKFHANLYKWQREKKCLVIVPESWDYLNIQYKDALLNDDKEKLKILEGINQFFKENGFLISDEAHLICDPLREAIKAIGAPKKLSLNEMDLFIKNYQVLTKNALVRLREGGQSFVTDKELPEIKKQLIEVSLNYEIFASEKGNPRLKEFLESPLTERPEWLEKMKGTELAELISLQHGFIQAILEHVLALKEDIDYGDSIHPGDLTAAPKHDRESTEAKFSDEYIWMALSIQRMLQKGIPLEGCKIMLAHLKEKSLHEDANQLLAKWLEGSGLTINLQHLSLKDEKTVQQIYKAIWKNEEAINHYLMEEVLPQIDIYHTKINSTAAEMLTAFAGGLLLTATPGAIETLPVAISLNPDKNKLDRASEGETVEAMLADRNKNVAVVDSFNPETFFGEVLKQNPDAFKDLAYMVDRGAGFRHVDSQEVVNAYLDFIETHLVKSTGAVYVDNVPNSKERSAFFLDAQNKDTKILEGSDLAEALKKQGVDPELLSMAFYYYSIRETIGTDWVLPKPSKGLFTVGEQQTATQSIQAVKRDRQFNSESQSITWVVPKKLLAAMGKSENDQVIPKEILVWMINNEAREQEKKIWMRFQQGVDSIIIQHAKEKMKNCQDPEEYKRLASVMKKENSNTVFERFYEPPALDKLGDKQQALLKIVLGAAAPLDIKELKDFSYQEQQELNALINQTAMLMRKITVAKQDFRAESIQETVQEEEQLQLQETLEEASRKEAISHLSIAEAYNHEVFSISSENFPKKDSVAFKAASSNNLEDFLAQRLTDTRETIKPHTNMNEALNLSADLPKLILSDPFMIKTEDKVFIRPPKAILVQVDRSVSPPAYKYIALSTKGYAHYKQEIVDNKNKGTNKEYVILSLRGEPLAKTKGMQSSIPDLKASEETQQILALTALMSGRIHNVEVAAKMVAPLGKEGFEQLIKTLRDKAIALNFKIDKIGLTKIYEKNAKLWHPSRK